MTSIAVADLNDTTGSFPFAVPRLHGLICPAVADKDKASQCVNCNAINALKEKNNFNKFDANHSHFISLVTTRVLDT